MPAAKPVAALASLVFCLSFGPAAAQESPSVGSEAAGRTEPILSYQVGAFAVKENADRLVAELFSRGYYGTVIQKTVRGKALWCVTIETSPNPFEDFQAELLAAGYPSFPLR